MWIQTETILVNLDHCETLVIEDDPGIGGWWIVAVGMKQRYKIYYTASHDEAESILKELADKIAVASTVIKKQS
ncbi:phage-like element pbsx protein XkdS [Thermanaeromonas toyohensis ToBE]|uniref:Phage-like element pbsx protein XkdS n=1 Tax=Thermanaeromonas toyohensis ToBE TaxID=698762 RepID=A0A1W1VXA0_9FIRM|nr:hypothetical protein [Thermanaeromonas toyohensis]SMB97997.1 phage-like element pbsx protein XkdS [Thermanaeromonas toyohensis ToBE]